jgi:hypothetical protein
MSEEGVERTKTAISKHRKVQTEREESKQTEKHNASILVSEQKHCYCYCYYLCDHFWKMLVIKRRRKKKRRKKKRRKRKKRRMRMRMRKKTNWIQVGRALNQRADACWHWALQRKESMTMRKLDRVKKAKLSKKKRGPG